MIVLIVDDSAAVRERLKELVSGVAAVEVCGQAADARQALAAIRELAPQVVILDLHMPGGNGLEVLEGVRRDPARPEFIVLTNYATPQYKQRCREAGARYFFDKSHDFEKVPEALADLAAAVATQ